MFLFHVGRAFRLWALVATFCAAAFVSTAANAALTLTFQLSPASSSVVHMPVPSTAPPLLVPNTATIVLSGPNCGSFSGIGVCVDKADYDSGAGGTFGDPSTVRAVLSYQDYLTPPPADGGKFSGVAATAISDFQLRQTDTNQYSLFMNFFSETSTFGTIYNSNGDPVGQSGVFDHYLEVNMGSSDNTYHGLIGSTLANGNLYISLSDVPANHLPTYYWNDGAIDNPSYVFGYINGIEVGVQNDIDLFRTLLTNSVQVAANLGRVGIQEPMSLGQIEAALIAPPGWLLKDIAALGGYDHFNWIQHITSVDGPPFITEWLNGRGTGLDPLLGGNPNEVAKCGGGNGADNLPWYWDEVSTGCPDRAGFDIESYTYGNEMDFFDGPNVCLPGSSLTFSTQLVGVRADGSGDVLDIPGTSFDWRYTQALPCQFAAFTDNVGSVTLQNIDPTLSGYGSIDILSGNLSQNGSVPEPSTWVMMIFGLGVVGVALRRRRGQPACIAMRQPSTHSCH